jgi:tetratricopeptide (TPR) repeat protein
MIAKRTMIDLRLTRRLVPLACVLALSGALVWAGAAPVAAPGVEAPGVAAPGVAAPDPVRAPYTPTQDAEVLQQVPAVADPAVKAMRSLRAKFEASPQDLGAAIELANAYIDYSRQIGDAHYAGYAEAVIAPWRARPTPPASVLLTEATILQYRHQFTDARDLLQKTLRLDPHNGQAWLTLATLDMVQGDYARVGKECAAVTNDADLDTGLACLGSLRASTGHARQSLVLLNQALAPGASPAYQAWVHGLLAESAERLGDWQFVEAEYRKALEMLPEDNFLLVAYADFLLDRGRAREVLPLLAGHEQSDTAFLRIALAQAQLGSPELVRSTWIMAARFAALRQRGSEYFGREEARFALSLQHDSRGSLDLALRNWQLQKAPWDARVVLEAALAAHDPRRAANVIDFVQETHLEDPIVVPLAKALRDELASATAAGHPAAAASRTATAASR